MGWQADDDPRPGDDPGPGSSLPELLAAFEHGGAWDTAAPSAALATALETAAGPGELYDGAEAGALVGIVRQWAAIESWAAAGMLSALRAMMREDGQGRPLLRRRLDLPDGWDDSLNYEVAAALAMGPVSAGNLAGLAWTLSTRLPGIGRLLARGILTKAKAKLIVATFAPLTESEATRAEALILGDLPGKTWFQVERLAWRAALAVAPDVAERRRADAERKRARVTLFREESGAAGLSGRDLPTAQALSGHANVLARAAQYEASGAFPGHTTSSLQALAYLHLLNNITAHDAIAFARTTTAEPPGTTTHKPDNENPSGGHPGGEDPDDGDPDDGDPDDGDPDGEDPGGADPEGGNPCGGHPGGEPGSGTDATGPDHSHDDDYYDDDDHDDDPGEDGDPSDGMDPSAGGDRAGGGDPSGGGGPGGDPGPDNGGDDGPQEGGPDTDSGEAGPGGIGAPTVLPEVITPLATLQRRAERPGDNRLLGPLDPALTRDLATAAARSPHTRWEITIIDDHGYAIGHGVARPGRGRRQHPQPPGPALCALPARVNITVTETLLHQLAAQPAQPRSGAPPGHWQLTPRTGKPDDDAWTLTLPGGRELAVHFDVVPTHECDHQHQTDTYQPTEKLRRLVQIRDHECTFPPCSRPAHQSDFEHAIPYHKGGRTDACNAGARSRRCHQVKQLPGWNLTQPKPGWHVWATPTGRSYTQGPWRYIG